MKSILRITLLLAAIYVFTGCHKTKQESEITGQWILNEVVQGDGYSWFGISTGFEHGVFNFYDNGSLSYSDAIGPMEGSWTLHTVAGNYYDEFGTYLSGPHPEMQVYLEDHQTGLPTSIYFTYVSFKGNSFVGIYSVNGTLTRYRFTRY